MFKAKFKDARIVKGMFEAVSAIISETLLKVDPDKGITLTAMDLSHICLVSLSLVKEDLDEFVADQKYELGINLEDLVKILKRSGSSDEISLIHDPKDKKLLIVMKPKEAKKARKFTISLIDIEGEEINLESLEAMEFDNKVRMGLKNLDEAIKDAEIFAEVLQVQAAQDKLIFSTTGNIGDMEYVLEKDELESSELATESTGIFAISFLKNILKISAIADKVELELKSEAPLKMIFDILNSSRIMYFLAPRVEEDDDSMYED